MLELVEFLRDILDWHCCEGEGRCAAENFFYIAVFRFTVREFPRETIHSLSFVGDLLAQCVDDFLLLAEVRREYILIENAKLYL